MTRPLRIEYPGAVYHVISRGNARQRVFLDDADKRTFLRNLSDCVELHNLICHAYCLMDNHYHLLIETPDGNLSGAMRDINGNYAQKFNARYNRSGHLWQGRYKSFVIEKDTYLLEVSRYIVNNPVEANVVDDPREYKWSSYNATAGFRRQKPWLEVRVTLSLFAEDESKARKRYRSFVAKAEQENDPYDNLKEGVILGSLQFVHWIWEKTKGSEEEKEIPRDQRIVGRPTLEELFEGVETKEERNAAIKIARFRCGYLTSEIASYLGLSRSAVGKISRMDA